MKFKEWIIDLFKDERGSTSVKPVIAILGALFLCTTMTINLFNNTSLKPSDHLIDAVVVITVIGMGADSLDKFSMKKKPEEPTQPPIDGEVQ